MTKDHITSLEKQPNRGSEVKKGLHPQLLENK